MIAYTGAGASAKIRRECARHELRILACPRDFGGCPATGRRVARQARRAIGKAPSWALDNGVFELHQRGERFEGAARMHWENLIHSTATAVEHGLVTAPDWCALPDIVGGGAASLASSMDALDEWDGIGLRWALVVQDGMTPRDLPWARPWHVVFVGGTLSWKLATGASWVEAAHAHGRPCHIGRVGTVERVRWALGANADSIDSCLPLWSVDKLGGFVEALGGHRLGPLFAAAGLA